MSLMRRERNDEKPGSAGILACFLAIYSRLAGKAGHPLSSRRSQSIF